MGNACLLDTNTVIYFLKGRLVEKDMKMVEKTIHDTLNISIITKIELLCWKTISPEETITIQDFINYAAIFYLDESLAEMVITVRKKYGLKLPDAIIAATAMLHNFSIITADKEFSRIPELDIFRINHL
jgi:predicted nucleic acid-binding protein